MTTTDFGVDAQVGEGGVQAVDDALGVDVDLLEVGGDVDVLEPAGQQDAGVVDHHVEAVTGRLREFAHPLRHLVGVGDVEVSGDRRAAELVDLVGQRLQSHLVDVVAADGVAVAGEGQRGGSADSRGGAGDEHGSVDAHTSCLLHRGEVVPEVPQAVGAAEQRGEVRGVDENDVAGALRRSAASRSAR